MLHIVINSKSDVMDLGLLTSTPALSDTKDVMWK